MSCFWYNKLEEVIWSSWTIRSYQPINRFTENYYIPFVRKQIRILREKEMWRIYPSFVSWKNGRIQKLSFTPMEKIEVEEGIVRAWEEEHSYFNLRYVIFEVHKKESSSAVKYIIWHYDLELRKAAQTGDVKLGNI